MLIIRRLQRRLGQAYGRCVSAPGTMLGAIGESVVGAPVIRAYGVAGRTARRLDEAIDGQRQAQQRAIRISVVGSSVGELAAGLALAGVVVLGVYLGVDGTLTVGQLTAFLFLVTLFIQPVQIATEVLNEAQNAIAGWRRVLDVLDVAPDVADPGEQGVELPPGRWTSASPRCGFALPGRSAGAAPTSTSTSRPRRRVAVVGETGSGKTTFAKLLTRLMDPTSGEVLLSGVPLPRVRFDSLRSRVVMVPQDGFLFDATVAENVRFARAAADRRGAHHRLRRAGADRLAGRPAGGAGRPRSASAARR